MTTLIEKQNSIIDDFELFDDWMQKYEYLIELGKDLPIINQTLEIVSIVIIIRVLILRQISFIPIHWQLIISNINFIAKMKLQRMIIERLMELKILLI